MYSARVHQKRERGRVESLVERYAEPLAALVPGYRWPAEELDRVWTLLLWNGAHDSSCGCSHDQVALDVDERFAEARATCEEIVADALGSLGASGRAGGRRSASTRPRSSGTACPGLGWAVGAADAPPIAPVELREGDDGAILADGLELVLLDEPDVGDLYNFCYAEVDQVPWGPAEIHVDGDAVRAWFDDALEVRMRVTRRADEPFIRLEGTIRNGRPDHRLRLHADAPAVRRPPPSPARRSSSSSGRSSRRAATSSRPRRRGRREASRWRRTRP